MRHKTGKSREHDAEKTERTEKTENGRAENKKMDIALSVDAFAGCNQLLRKRCQVDKVGSADSGGLPDLSGSGLLPPWHFSADRKQEHGLRTGYALFFCTAK